MLKMFSSQEVAVHIAQAMRSMRLSQNLSQETLSSRSGVSLGVLKKFEHTGKISLESLLKLALALGHLNEFMDLFKPASPESFSSLDELLKEPKTRKRGRK
jgi:transcriptional regulator with XRE-family HTH domain